MPNVTEIKRALPFKFSLAPDRTLRRDEPPYALWGGIARFIFYWLAFAAPILQFGANALFFLLYTWPFFLALLLVCVLVGVVFSVLLGGKLWLTVLVTGLSVFCLFWLVFTFLSGW
ncbi:Putative membrane protein [Candidatus Sodalis pierantonius str. SOPE]|uniref:Putative membrane protein n=1 Tax=Candidatus Sodalis pierantonii str. SOPE TaxID=2342 RepID=W0HMG7_9GAMM|nr:DUF3561 family protein [Candidatus Sodalis pierantonius]AHF73385.1 Putative membrane protein [Candidatus Sodalis pierantonius str. SOPE]